MIRGNGVTDEPVEILYEGRKREELESESLGHNISTEYLLAPKILKSQLK